ncbi:MAG: translocation/assembly module TamB domain-containing protein, partial [Gammaproteobacteria bacterium]|nr:translocation/assembly module TamB domain-containing protein [Gammaproteobacteria bacterium]
MTEPTTPAEATPAHPPPATPRRSRGRRALRALGWSFAALVLMIAVLLGGAWWWIGSNQSLAVALAQAARFMPAGQSLESRDVSGSLRTGGKIGWLRYQTDTLAVEVHGARIGWQLAPLLQRKVRLGEVHADQVLLEPRTPAEPPPKEPLKPLEGIALPVDVDVPFSVDVLRWAGPPPIEAKALAGRYRYTDDHHLLDVQGVDVADGHYSANVKLQGPAPMAIDARLNGSVRAPLTEGRAMDVLADATVQGQLAGADARLKIDAHVKPAEASAEAPMKADVQATLAPWNPQPVVDAKVDLENLDVARLLPDAPQTQLSGHIEVGPDPAGASGSIAGTTWQASVDIRNALPGPWDTGKVPVERIEARGSYDGTTVTLPSATVRAGGGRIEAQGQWSPAPSPWQAEATVTGVRPGQLHTQLAGAPISGTLKAEQQGDALDFDLALRAQGGAAGATALEGLGLDRVLASGRWQNQVLDLNTLRVEAEGASIEGKLQLRVADQGGNGNVKLVLPGANAQLQGRIAPTTGGGDINLRIDNASELQRWVERLPGLSKAFAGATMQGDARLDAKWQGGWQAVQRRLQNADQPAARGVTEPTLKASLSTPRFDVRLPPPDKGPATAVSLRDLKAELDGSLAQATLSLKGQARTGTQTIDLDTRASGGLARAKQWRATIESLRVQAQDNTQAQLRAAGNAKAKAPWTVELGQPVTATVRADGARMDVQASASSATLRGPAPGTVRIDWEPISFSQSGIPPNRAFRLQSKGRLEGLPMAWAEAAGGNSALSEVGVTGDLLFNGAWDIDVGDTLRARVRLARQSGDIRVQAGEAALVTRITSTGTGTESERTMNAGAEGPSTPAGLRQAELRIDAEGDGVRANLVWDSERAGQVRAELGTRLQQRADGWQWADDAPLDGKVTARLPQLGVWSMLAPPGWRIAGTLEADAALSGSRTDPRWNGSLSADKLALRAFVEGLDLRDGRLRASMTGNRLQINEFTLQGGPGSNARIAGQSGNVSTASSQAAAGGGSLSVRGDVSWGAQPAQGAGTGIRMALQAQVRSLRALVRSDRQMTLSGDIQAQLDDGQIKVRGGLKVDRAVIILPGESAPSLGSDVVVRSAAIDREARAKAQQQVARNEAQAAKAQTAKPPDVAVEFDLGNDFAVQGRGITTRLEGKLDIRSTSLTAPPRITGEVRTVKGRYRAYGQELDVETGLARFNGPFDNPSLDILAIRPNITQRAGVQITGTAQSPRVKLYSEPALPDAETLSWVVLGRSSAAGGAESAVLQQAALAIIGGLTKGNS